MDFFCTVVGVVSLASRWTKQGWFLAGAVRGGAHSRPLLGSRTRHLLPESLGMACLCIRVTVSPFHKERIVLD